MTHSQSSKRYAEKNDLTGINVKKKDRDRIRKIASRNLMNMPEAIEMILNRFEKQKFN